MELILGIIRIFMIPVLVEVGTVEIQNESVLWMIKPSVRGYPSGFA